MCLQEQAMGHGAELLLRWDCLEQHSSASHIPNTTQGVPLTVNENVLSL